GLPGEPRARCSERVRITIETDGPADAVVEECPGVAATTEGTVEDERRAAEQLDYLGGKSRGMIVGVPGTRGALVEASRSVGHTTAEPCSGPAQDAHSPDGF